MSREAQLEGEWKHWKVNLQIFSRESNKQQLPLISTLRLQKKLLSYVSSKVLKM